MAGLNGATPLYVAPYPVAWKIETVKEEMHRGFEHVRSELGVTRYSGIVLLTL